MSLLRQLFAALFLLLAYSVHAQIYADFTMDRIGGCSPLNVSFTNQSSGLSTNARFTWDLGNGNQSSLRNPSAIYTTEKTYTVTLTITDGSQTATRSKTVTVYQKPTVDFAAVKPKVCLPDAAQFTVTGAAGDGYISSYQWDMGDGNTQQGYGNSYYYYYSKEHLATVSLTVTNSFGCQAMVAKQNVIEILGRMNPAFSNDKNMLCSLDEKVQFTNTSTGPGTLMYNWDFGDNTTSTAINPLHQFTKKGLFQPRLTVSNEHGCSATAYSTQINAAYFNTDFSSSSLCRQANFSSSSYLYPTNSHWDFGNGNATNSNYTTTYTYPAAGTYNVTLINTYGTCKDTVSKTITIKDGVNYNSGITMPSTSCLNTGINFTSTSSTPPSQILWDFGDNSGLSTTYQQTSHYYTQPGTYTVSMTNIFGTCKETITKTIVINPVPTVSGFVVDFGGVCGAPVTVTFTDTSANAVGWQWYRDYFSTPFANTKKATYSFSSDGYYTIGLTVTNAFGCSSNTNKQISIYKPTALIYTTYTSSPRGNYDCDSLQIRLAANGNQPIQSYSWDLGNGVTSTSPTPEAFYDKPGTYPITLTYVTESGCTSKAYFSVRVYDKPKANFSYNVPCVNSLDLQFNDISPFSDNWQWKYSDGGLGYGNPTIHTFQDTGKYSVQFINSIGHCSDTIVKTVYANALPANIYIIKSANQCDETRGTVLFDQRSVRASGGTWDFGDGTTIPYDTSAHTISHTYKATGTYTVTLRSTYGSCQLSSVTTVRVLLKQSPTLTVNKTQLCANETLTLTINGLQTNPFTGNYQYGQYTVSKIEYNTGGSYSGYIDNYPGWTYTNYAGNINGLSAGVTKLRAIVTNPYTGCSDTTNYVNVQVNGPIAGFKIQDPSQCFKSPFVFTDTSRSVTTTALRSWQWDFGDGTTLSGTAGGTVQHTYKIPGYYPVRLTVTDATGCYSTFSYNVNARGTKAAFSGSGLFYPNVPLNTTVSFNNYSNTSNSNPTYQWNFGDGATSNQYYGSHTYTQAAVNTVTLITSDPTIPCSDTAQQVITVKDFNTAFSFTSTLLNANSCPPVLVRINNLSVGYYNLKWDFGDGTTTTASSYPSHIYQQPGVYKITLYTYGYNGLTGTYIDSVTVGKKPTAQINSDLFQGCLSQSVRLNAITEGAASYLWDFGDGSVNKGSAAMPYSFTSAGIYTPRLIVKDTNGCAASADLAAPIVIDSLSAKILGIPSLICDAALIPFTAQVYSFAATKLGATLSYKWDFGTGIAADTANIANPSFRYTAPGTYTVKLKVSSPYGCSKETTETVVVKPKPKATITAVQEVCQDGSVQFTGAATPTGIQQWNWDFANGNTASVQTPTAQLYTKPGTYQVLLTAMKDGCTDTVRHQLVVNAKPIINASPKQSILCFGNTLSLSASGGGTYQWSPAAGLNNASVANPVASPVVNTNYLVTVTTNKGCVDKDSLSIVVAQPIKVQLQNALDVCAGTQVQLTASGATSYQWINTTTGLSNASIANPVATPTQTIVYTVVGSDNYNCFKDTAIVTINVRKKPTVNAGPDLQLQGNNPYQLTTISSADVTSWAWTPSAELSCATCANPIVTPKNETSYIVTVSNQWGCTASDTVLIKLACIPDKVYFPTAFTPNNDGKNDVFYVLGSGVKTVRFLRIYSRWGDVVFERTNFAINDKKAGWNGRIKDQMAAPGTYVFFAEMECSSGEIFTRQGTITLIQ